jgi:hypothetical protein
VGWLIAIIVSIALIFFMIVSPGFRYLIIGIVVLGAIAIYVLIEHDKKESEHRQQIAAALERAALSAISTTDIALDPPSVSGALAVREHDRAASRWKHRFGRLCGR